MPPLLPELEEIMVKEERTSSQRRDDPEISPERLLTADDVGTMVEVCVALLVLSAGVITYVIGVSLLLLLVSVGAHFWVHCSPL